MDSRVFFIGVIVLVVGLLIVVYDAPQVVYINTLTVEQIQAFDRADQERFERVQIELYVGVGILAIGGILIVLSKFPVFIKN